MSTSYPYLTFARDYGYDYGKVLTMVDWFERCATPQPFRPPDEETLERRTNKWLSMAQGEPGWSYAVSHALLGVIRGEYARRGVAIP
jgi:hypothetical protein